MAILRLGMGETGVTTTPDRAGEFMDGAKVWLSPSTIGSEFSALTTAAKADLVGTLTSPRALGFLLVPAAAILLLVWGMGAAKRRRRNPARSRMRNPRRRAARKGRRRNPGRKSGAGHQYEVVVGNVGTVYRGRQGFQAHLDYNKYVGISKRGGGRTEGEPVTLFMDGEIIKEYAGTVENPKRRRNATRRRSAGPRAVRRTQGAHGRRNNNPGGNPDWMSHRAATGEDPLDVAFDAGKQWGETGADESGVANARVRHYGFVKWYNNQAPSHMVREGPPARKMTKAQLERAFNDGYKIGKEKADYFYKG